MVGLGFSALYARVDLLLANTAPVAFGSIGIPVITLAAITGLPLAKVSGHGGLAERAVSLLLPAYLILGHHGLPAMLEVWPATADVRSRVCGHPCLRLNCIGPQLADILASIGAMGALILLLRFWEPRHNQAHERKVDESMKVVTGRVAHASHDLRLNPHYSAREIVAAHAIAYAAAWWWFGAGVGDQHVLVRLNSVLQVLCVAGTAHQILRMPPVSPRR